MLVNLANLLSLKEAHDVIEMAHTDGLVQDFCISIANALEILQSCSKQLIYL